MTASSRSGSSAADLSNMVRYGRSLARHYSALVAQRILVVEDDDDIAQIVTAVARDEGWDVVVARDGEEGMQRWREHGADLLVLDLHLPGVLDGLDVFQEIRRASGAAPMAVILSAAEEAPRLAKELGLPLVRKPFELADLVAAMRTALAA